MDVSEEIHPLDDIVPASINQNQSDDNMLPIELTNATGTYLLDLNEDCLLQIFSYKSLSLIDLCSLAETCTTFKRITQRVFPKEFSIERYRYLYRRDLGYIFKSRDHLRDYYTLHDVERMIKNFGSNLSTLKMDGDLDVVKVLNLVAQYRGDDSTLKRLEISRIRNVERVPLNLKAIFEGLLQLSVCFFDHPIASSDVNRVNWNSLIELKISWSRGCIKLLNHTFPNLERFVFISDYYATKDTDGSDILCMYNTSMIMFIRRHAQLKTIYLKGRSFFHCEFLDTISSSCNELVELTLRDYTKTSLDISHLQDMAKLKMLHIDFGDFLGESGRYDYSHCQDIQFSRAFKSLETIKIARMDGAEIFTILSQLKNLRELHLTDCAHELIPWSYLTQLRKVLCDSPIDNEIVQPLVNLEELRCVINLNEDFVSYEDPDEYSDED